MSTAQPLKTKLSTAQPLKTKITLDGGTLVHFIFGLLALLLDQAWLFTVIFLTKQMIDLAWGHEEPSETGGDIAEYSLGVVIGLVLMKLLGI